jgi:hypothetical protein
MCAIINNYNKAWHNGYHCVYFTTRCYDKVCISNVKSGKKSITMDVPRVQMSGCTCAFPQGALSEVFCLSSFRWGLLLMKEELGLSIICVFIQTL